LLCKDRNTAPVTAQLTSQSLLYDRAGASASEEPYKEVVPEKRRYLLYKTTNFEGKVEKVPEKFGSKRIK